MDRGRGPRRLLALLVGIAAFAVPQAAAQAATIVVSTTTDELTAGDGHCSLREAIAAVDNPGSASGDCAAAAFGPNTIALGANTYELSIYAIGTADNATDNSKGDLAVTASVSDLTIQGVAAGATVIDASGLHDPNGRNTDRVLDIASGASVTLTDLTVTGGHAPDGACGAGGSGMGSAANGGNGTPGVEGGGIRNQGTLSLIDVTVSNNAAGAGGCGGDGEDYPPPAGTGTIGNGGNGASGGRGGGVYSTGSITVSGSTIAGNRGGKGGNGGRGGGDNPETGGAPGGNGGSGGCAGDGGGIANVGGSVTIDDTTVSGNHAGDGGNGGGGGTASNGTGGTAGSACAGGSGGGLFVTGIGSLTGTNDTLAANFAGAGGTGGYGGGDEDINTSQCVGTGQPGAAGGAGGSGGGAGLSTPGGMSLISTTVVGNDTGPPGAGGQGGCGQTFGANGATGAAGGGGGVSEQTGFCVINKPCGAALQNTIVASNSGGNCSGPLGDNGHNLQFGDATCPSTFASGDPKLGVLTDNGGPTQTVDLGSGSAAIDQVPSSGAGCPMTDQRGVPRPFGPACDIGAYEVTPPAVITGGASGVTTTGATVSGTVTANAGASSGGASVHFDFGATTGYGSSTATQTVTGVSPVAVSATLSGLSPNTTYHYRAVASAIDGTTMGADQTFTTAALPGGGGQGGTGPTGGSPTAPVLGSLSLSPRTFKAASSGASIARSGTTISYTDSQAAKTTFVVLRPEPGVRRGNRCVKPTKPKPGTRVRHCTRYVSVGSFAHTDAAGANHLHFTGRVKGRRLKPGAYKLSATPRANGKTGKTVSKRFRVIR